MRLIAFALAALALTATVSSAAPLKDLLSWDRLYLSAGAQQAWTQPTLADLKPRSEVEAGAYGAYVLTRHLSLIGASTYGFTSKDMRYTVGVRVALKLGKEE
jgi:hypothetical protein